MIKVAVCEDEKTFYRELEKYVGIYAQDNNVSVTMDWFKSAEEFLECYSMQFDLVFMDIKMKDMSGIEAAKKIREKDKRTAIVFLTAFLEFALEGYNVDASDYIVKPITLEKVERAFRKSLGSLHKREQVYLVKYKGTIQKVFVSDILYVESYRHKRYYHLIDGVIEEDIGTLKEIMERDQGLNFMMIQKGCIVNKSWIERCYNQVVKIRGTQKEMPVSRLRWKDVEYEFLIHCRERTKIL